MSANVAPTRIWYSARGARRGLRLGALIAALWACWASGFLQGRSSVDSPPPSTRIDAGTAGPCCDPQTRI